MSTKSKSESSQKQKSLSNSDESVLYAGSGATVYKLGQTEGDANVTVNGLPGGEVLGIVDALIQGASSVIGGIQDQVKTQSENINAIATTATGTQTELERIINKLILPGFIVGGLVLAMMFWRRK